MAATDARPVPRKNAAFRLYFCLRNLAAQFVTGWTGADSEISKDGAAFSDCTNEATEIGASGHGYLDFTSSEMNADAVLLKITFTNLDVVPISVSLFPEELGDLRTPDLLLVGTAQGGALNYITLAADAPAAANCLRHAGLTITGGTGQYQGSRVITKYNATTKRAYVYPPFVVAPDNTTTYAIGGLGIASAAIVHAQ